MPLLPRPVFSHVRNRAAVLLLFAGVCSEAFPGCASAQGVPRTLVYSAPGARAEGGDLLLPAGAGPFPVVLYLHGGSWRSGGKGEFRKLAADLATRGYASFSIDYDLRPHSFPESWNEARAAVVFLRSHAAEYRIDPRRIVAAGSSAGGELASLLALEPKGPAGGSDRTELPVAAAVILSGVFDLHADVHVITRYLGGRCEFLPAQCTDASPAAHIHPGAPPFFVGHGTADHVVAYGEAQRFLAGLQQAGAAVTPFVAEDGPHMYWEKKRYYAANLAALADFLARTLPRKE